MSYNIVHRRRTHGRSRDFVSVQCCALHWTDNDEHKKMAGRWRRSLAGARDLMQGDALSPNSICFDLLWICCTTCCTTCTTANLRQVESPHQVHDKSTSTRSLQQITAWQHVEMLCGLLYDSLSDKSTTKRSSGVWPRQTANAQRTPTVPSFFTSAEKRK